MFRRLPATPGNLSPHGLYEQHSFTVGAEQRHVYLLICTATRDAVLIDAADEAERLRTTIAKRRARLRMIVLTHGHAHCWGALGVLRDAWRVPVGIHLDDAEMLPLTPNFALEDRQRLEFGATSLRVLHAPGHTPGSVCFVGDGELFSGDSLFPSTAEQPHADVAAWQRSLRERVYTLQDATRIFPSHGTGSTLLAARAALRVEDLGAV